jgi:hypothetical protein
MIPGYEEFLALRIQAVNAAAMRVPDENADTLARAGMANVKSLVGLYLPDDAPGFDSLRWIQKTARLYQVIAMVIRGQVVPSPYALYLFDGRGVRARGEGVMPWIRGMFRPDDVRVKEWDELTLGSQYQALQDAMAGYFTRAARQLTGSPADLDAFFSTFAHVNIDDKLMLQALGKSALSHFQSLSPADPERAEMRRAAPAIYAGWQYLAFYVVGEQKNLPVAQYSEEASGPAQPVTRIVADIKQDEEEALRDIVGSANYDKTTLGARMQMVTALKEGRDQAEAGRLDPKKAKDLIDGRVQAVYFQFDGDPDPVDILGAKLAEKLTKDQTATVLKQYKDMKILFLNGGNLSREVAEKQARAFAVGSARSMTARHFNPDKRHPK